ncbi:sulfotransferase domain-containing protein [Emticicia sp. TH156]|uniref:sulfotransferase domain-containing protein n=1 Tax=Emticicia sp. TH156 TaxID=2067454 RepID=UPI000C794AB6|nr:sulfotransferase domain-containing protein [Emticicia sp. TH156]PLK43453.1 sulfotransferase [Emticicia sp. TH156]
MNFKVMNSGSESEMNPKIVWLASYPKSGNTWFRSFLSALIGTRELDINNLETDGIFSGKNNLEMALDIDSDYINQKEAENYKRIAFRYLSAENCRLLYVKIHDAFTYSEFDKLPLVPEEPTKMAIYLIRNPLDIAVSLANHLDDSIDNAIEKFLTNQKSSFGTTKNLGIKQFYQPLGTWSGHVESWLKHPSFPVHFIRYEDLKIRPFETFKAAVTAIGLQVTDEKIQEAIELTKFEKLKKQEEQSGFKEKQVPDKSFFFKGESGRWKEELSTKQIEKIREANQPMMEHFGYW